MRIHIVPGGPASPYPSDGWSRVHQHAVHIDKQALANDLRHTFILSRASYELR
jgi:hypothetical protein